MSKSTFRLTYLFTVVGFAFFMFRVGDLLAAPDYSFIGAKKCSICHKRASIGNQFGIWQDTAHAHAYEVLASDHAKEVAQKMGIADPQQSGKCLRCHSTAYGFSEEKVSSSIPVSEGVSCESCHGPGSGYWKMSVMKDKEQAIANGLVIPDEQTCFKCHNQESPTFKPFDYKERWKKIKHMIPK